MQLICPKGTRICDCVSDGDRTSDTVTERFQKEHRKTIGRVLVTSDDLVRKGNKKKLKCVAEGKDAYETEKTRDDLNVCHQTESKANINFIINSRAWG